MVGMLLDHGANVNSVDDDGDTALHITLTKEHALPRNLGVMTNEYLHKIPCCESVRGVQSVNKARY